MSDSSPPLPPELAQVERALASSRAPLPEGLRARVLAAVATARPRRPQRLPGGWFAAAVAVAAAALLNLSGSAALPLSPEPAGLPASKSSLASCTLAHLFSSATQPCVDVAPTSPFPE
jgi:hypothetical protein